MATKLYLSSDTVSRYDPSTRRGAWDKTTGLAAFSRLTKTPTGGGNLGQNTDANATVDYDVLVTGGVSDPLLSNVTISGTLDFALLMCESNADTDAKLHLHIWVTQGDSASLRGTLLSDWIDSNELPSGSTTQAAGLSGSGISLSSVNAQAGDRIVIEIGARCGNNFSTSRTLTCNRGSSLTVADAVGNESANSTGNLPFPWFNFSSDFEFSSMMLYLTSQSAPVTPGATHGTWDTGSPTDYYLSLTKGGSRTSAINVSETNTTDPWDVIVARFVSDELATQTIPSMATWVWANLNESGISANVFQRVHAWIMKPDGTQRGNLINNSEGISEVPSATNPDPEPHALGGLSVLNGDRLVLEVGAEFQNTTATSQSFNYWFGNTDADGPGGNPTSETLKSGWLYLPKRLIFSSGGSNFGGQVVMIG